MSNLIYTRVFVIWTWDQVLVCEVLLKALLELLGKGVNPQTRRGSLANWIFKRMWMNAVWTTTAVGISDPQRPFSTIRAVTKIWSKPWLCRVILEFSITTSKGEFVHASSSELFYVAVSLHWHLTIEIVSPFHNNIKSTTILPERKLGQFVRQLINCQFILSLRRSGVRVLGLSSKKWKVPTLKNWGLQSAC